MKTFSRIIVFLLVAAVLAATTVIASSALEAVTVTFHSNDGSADDVFRTESVSGGSLNASYSLPGIGGKAFAGWYYDEQGTNAVDFGGDTFTSDTELYARWIDLSGFTLEGVQLRSEGGMRYITDLNNSLLGSLDTLSDNTVGENQSRVEYGFVATKEANIDRWLEFAGDHLDAQTYELGYNGTNVNGVDTTRNSVRYQGFVKNIDCTAGDYSASDIEDYESNADNRLFTFAVTYENADDKLAEKIAARAYLRYYDANGLLRTVYSSYAGTDSYGGCSSSYNGVENVMENTRCYSSVEAMAADADNLTVENGSASSENAVGSMYISEGKAYMKLLSDAESGSITLNTPADLNLSGKTLTLSAGALSTNDSFRMYNGTYEAKSAPTFSKHSGGFTKIQNVDFIADDLSNTFTGLRLNDTSYIYRCGFDVELDNTSAAACVATISTGCDTTVNECDYRICSNADQIYALRSQNGGNLTVKNSTARVTDKNGNGRTIVGVYCQNESVTIDNCDLSVASNTNAMGCYLDTENSLLKGTGISVEGLSQSANCYGTILLSSNTTDVIRDSSIKFSGSYSAFIGIWYLDAETETGSEFTLENTSVDMDITSLDLSSEQRSYAHGMYLTSNISATIRDYACKVNTVLSGSNPIAGASIMGNSTVDFDGVDIEISTESDNSSDWNWIVLRGLNIGDSAQVALTDADIRVPAYSQNGNPKSTNYNLGIELLGDSKLSINEDGGTVYIAGGNAAIHTGDNSELYISGGKFCSPAHGGAYIGGKSADITGGEFFTFYVPDYERYGAVYVTNGAQVNIDGARLYGAEVGVRAKKNTDPCTAVVNVSHCYIEHSWDSAFYATDGGVINNDGTNTTKWVPDQSS